LRISAEEPVPGFVSLENRLPALWQTSPVPQAAAAGDASLVRSLASAEPERPDASALPVNLAVSHILMNAQSLIASVTGLKPHQVHVSVNLARYEF
jgi:hypothetical protein